MASQTAIAIDNSCLYESAQKESVGRIVAKKTLEETQTELRIHKARLESKIELSEDAIITKTLQGVIQSWNASAQRIFGYTADEAIGKTIYLIIPPELRGE